MKVLVLLLLVAVCSALRGVKKLESKLDPELTSPREDQLWYSQKLDHFDIAGTPHWNQRYWKNLDYYKPGGPAFIMIGGEAEANPRWMTSGLWHTAAQEHGAAMFLLEHRYYGQSKPVEDMTDMNMKFLSSRQGLEDLATFMVAMSIEHDFTSPWVSFGGSYPGSLSAWLKLKYPHMMAGAVSSSGPLYAKMDFFEYLGVVAEATSECIDKISAALHEIENLIANEENWLDISNQFKLCNTLDGYNEDDVKSFFEYMIDNLAGIVQYNGRFDLTIDGVCKIMNSDENPLTAYAALNDAVLNMNQEECVDHEFSSFLNLLTDTSFEGTGVGWRQWTWQTCTEFGWYQTTNQPDNTFGTILNLDFFKSWCARAFPEYNWDDNKFEGEMMDTNTEYGGFIPHVDNVVFVHGTVDPWHAMGVMADLNEKATAIVIPGTSHCADMYDDKSGDPQELLEARQEIKRLITRWLSFIP